MLAALSAPAAPVARPRLNVVSAPAPARKSRRTKRRGSYGKTKVARPFYRSSEDAWYLKTPDLVPVFGKGSILLARGRENEAACMARYAEVLAQLDGAAVVQAAPADAQRIDTLADAYLQWYDQQGNDEKRTANVHRYLKDFCGYCGANTVNEFAAAAKRTPDKDAFTKWLDQHKGWHSDSSRRGVVKMVKAFFNWCCAEMNLSRSPLVGYPTPPEVSRITIFDAEQEAAVLALCIPAYRQFVAACIATGGRPAEVASVDARKVVFDESGKPVAWDFKREHKNGKKGKDRVIYLTPELSALTAELVKLNPTGPLFRNMKGKPINLCAADKWFRELKPRVNKSLPPHKHLGDDYVLYSARHTFIVRQLIRTGGDVALVAEMAGNTIAVIDKHYKKWGKQRGRILDTLARS